MKTRPQLGLALAFLAGCGGVGPVEGTTTAPTVVTRAVASVEVDAHLPSDLLARPDGSWLVLDGYRGRILAFGPDGTARGAWAETGIGRPVRLSPARDGGVWAAVPGLDDEAGLALHLDGQGALVEIVAPATADGTPLHPVDVVEFEGELLVADRTGGLASVSLETGLVTRTQKAAEPVLFRRVVDLAERPEGGIAAVDALASDLALLAADGTARAPAIRHGLNAGQLTRPSAVAPVGDALLVSDTVLGAVQAFDEAGALVGVLADAAGPLTLGHPVAVRAVPAGQTLTVGILEASPARLRLVELAAPLPPAPPPALIRTPLVGSDADPAGAEGASCLQCHDGLVLDSREVWDPGRKHHPVGMVPERALPEVFELDDAGKMVCTTCHSPHGVVEGDAAAAPLVRHRSSDSPFTRLEKDADALCIACHAEDEHVNTGAETLDPRVAGHPTGMALVRALEARGDTAEGPADPTRASCLSCHAMHGATGEAITRDPGDGATCLGCHPSGARSASNHPLGRVPGSDLVANHKDARVVLAPGGGIGCLTCHDLEGTRSNHLVRTLGRGTPVCLDCHAARTDLAGGPHAHLEGAGLPTCVACHDVHGGVRADHFLTATPGTEGDPGGCLACHGPGGRAASGHGSPGRVGHPVDGRVADGKDPLTCLSCHDPHSAAAPTPGDCMSCHTAQAADHARGGHGSATCLDCHPAHTAVVRAAGDFNPSSARCLACHSPEAGEGKAPRVAEFEHPAPAFKPDGSRWSPLGGLVLYDAAGNALPADQNGELVCESCHLVHGPDAAGDPKLRRGGAWKTACASCHGDDALALYQYFHKPELRKDVRGEGR